MPADKGIAGAVVQTGQSLPTARLLGVSRVTLQRKMKSLGLREPPGTPETPGPTEN